MVFRCQMLGFVVPTSGGEFLQQTPDVILFD
jgi:hypothetical protein